MSKPRIDNVLAARYATPEMCAIWSPEGKILLERDLWIAVMTAQRELGLDIPAEAIAAYQRARGDIDLERIAARERALRHDVKARIEEFNALAGWECIHQGMTSRDLTDNVEQAQIRRALALIRDRGVAALRRLRENAVRFRDVAMVARTHNVPAQATTVGRRLAMYGAELLLALETLETLLARYPLRGIVGAVGTALDQLTLLGDPAKVDALNARVAALLGFDRRLGCTGQIYPRSLDFEVVAAVYQICSAPANFARTLRLMAGAELAREGFQPGQVGSSAMPHKMNARSSERINALHHVLGGALTMTAALCGDQWNEGDVSCSVVRRVALPDAMFAADGLLETFLVIQQEFTIHETAMAAELARLLPLLASTTLLMEAVRRGMGREEAHAVIKRHALHLAEALRTRCEEAPALARLLGDDPAFPMSTPEIEALLADTDRFIGAAAAQVDAFAEQALAVEARFPQAAAYQPGEIL